MEKKLNRTISIVLPITYEIKQLRQKYPFYKYLIFCLEVFVFLSFPLQYSMSNSDQTLQGIIKTYQQYILYNRISLVSIIGLFLFFIVIFLLGLITVSIKLSMASKPNHQQIKEKAKRFYLVVFVIFQVSIMPAFIVSTWNIINNTFPQLKTVSFIIFIITLVIIGFEDERRLYQFSIITIIFFKLLTSSLLTNAIIFVFSFKRGRAERKQLHKKVVYYQFAYWSLLIFIVTTFEWQINYFYLFTILFIIGGQTIINSFDRVLTSIEQNEKLMDLTDQIIQGKQLSVQSQLFISKCFCSLKYSIETQDIILDGQEKQFQNLQMNFTTQQMLRLLTLKIDAQIKRQYSHFLKIQGLQAQIRFNKFSMKTLYNMEKLIEDIKLQSTFQEKQKLYDLVNLTERKFLSKEDQFNAKTVINVQKYKQEISQSIINIAIIMQQFWILHKHNRLNDEIISTIISKILEMQQYAEQTLDIIDKYNSISQQLVIFEYLKKMNDCSYQLTKKEYKTQQRYLLKPDLNYIVIEQGNIIQVSNQLLNQFKLSKLESEEYHISDIIYKPISQYLTDRLDKIIEEQAYRKDVKFILPLTVSRQHLYIQPYNSSIKILPELINGIKYIINLQKTIDLQNPMILYQGKTDKIVGISKNFNNYLDLQNQQYIFEQFCNNVDILKLADSNSNEIACQINVRKKGKKTNENKYMKISLVLKKIKMYQVKDNYLILISVKKQNYYEINQTMNRVKPVFTVRALADNQNNVCMINFCKISNPYQHLIDQKISKRDQFYRMSFLKAILIIVFILIILVVVFIVILNIHIDDVQDAVSINYKNKVLLNDKEVNTYSLFRESAILYHLRKYPTHFQSIFPAYNLSSLEEDYASRVNQQIKIILSEDIIQIKSKKGYTYDIIQDAKYLIATNNISLLLKNWNNLKKSTTISFNEIFENLNIFFQQYQFIFISVMIVFLFLFGLICYLIEDAFDRILYIYLKMDFKQSNKFIEDYRLFTHQLYQSKYFKGVKSNKYLKAFENKDNLGNIDQLGTFSYIQNNLGFDMHTNQVITNNGPNSQIGRKSIINVLCRQSYICLIFVFFYAFIFTVGYYIKNYEKELNQIAQHSVILHSGRENLNFNSALFLISSLQQTLPLSERQVYHLPSQIFLSIELNSKLPKFFQNFTSSENLMTSNNLCNYYLNSNESLYRPIKCGDILDGILTINFPQAVVNYNKIVNLYLNRNMSQFQNMFRKGAKYPVFMEIAYSGKSLFNLMTAIQKIFNALSKVYIIISKKILGFIIRLGWILLPLFLIIGRIYYSRQYLKCKIFTKLFFILPKSYLLQIKVTKILRQKAILNCIERLSF